MPAFPGTTPAQGSQRVLAGVTATLEWVNLDQNGSPVDPAGAVTVEVVRADGTEVLAPETPTDAGVGAGARTVTLTPAQNDRVDILTATWTDAGDDSVHTSHHEVGGGFHFSVEEARATDPSFASYSLAEILAVRTMAEDAIETACGRAFVRRLAFELHEGDGSDSLLVDNTFPRLARSLLAGGVAFAPESLADLSFDSSGEITRRSGRFAAGTAVTVAYEHGEDAPPPIIKRAGLLWFKENLPAFVSTGVGIDLSRALSVRLDGVGVSLGSETGSTGLPEVDRLIAAWRGNSPVVA